MGKAVEITDSNFNEIVSNSVVLVDFGQNGVVHAE